MSDYSFRKDETLDKETEVATPGPSAIAENPSLFASVSSTSDTVYEFPDAATAASNQGTSGGILPNYSQHVAEPALISTQEQPVHTKPRRLFWRLLAAFFVGGLVASIGFGSAFFLIDRDEEVNASDDAVPSFVAPSNNSSGETTPVIEAEGGEPAIFVAEALGPAIVQMETDIGSGSGVVYKEGLILTNYHVVEGADQVNVRQSNGRLLEGEVVGFDERIDIAVVSVDSSKGLPVAPLALGEPAQVGQITVAIGSPFQLQQTVTDGIVSAVNRPLLNVDGQTFKPMIQTNAAINPGNSGGALADINGRVIGINTAIQTDGVDNTNAGIGFAIPIDLAVRIADLLVEGKAIESGVLGVIGAFPPSNIEVGVEITEVTEDSAAEKAGIKVGDRVLTVDGAPVASFAELAGLVGVRQPGDEIELQVARGDAEDPLVITATLGTR